MGIGVGLLSGKSDFVDCQISDWEDIVQFVRLRQETHRNLSFRKIMLLSFSLDSNSYLQLFNSCIFTCVFSEDVICTSLCMRARAHTHTHTYTHTHLTSHAPQGARPQLTWWWKRVSLSLTRTPSTLKKKRERMKNPLGMTR